MATSEFGKAFSSARKAGKKTFTFKGKKYTTKTKEESAPPKPKTRPKTVKESPIPKGNNPTPGGKAKKSGTNPRVADAKVKADAAREERIKKSQVSAANLAYAKRVTGRNAG